MPRRAKVRLRAYPYRGVSWRTQHPRGSAGRQDGVEWHGPAAAQVQAEAVVAADMRQWLVVVQQQMDAAIGTWARAVCR